MRNHVIFITASPVIFVADLEVVTTAPVIVVEPTKPELPKAIEKVIQATCSLTVEMKEAAAELERMIKAIKSAKLADPVKQDTNEYRPSWDRRRLPLAQGHPRPIYWHRIRSNPG